MSKRQYPRPNGSVTNWSVGQASKYIKSCLEHQPTSVLFVQHAKDRQFERKVSDADAMRCIAEGRAVRFEPSPKAGAKMRCNFELSLKIRTIKVVVEISDENPLLIVVTVMSND